MPFVSEFVDYLAEVFEPFGEVRARRMFGGYGIYHNDLMFGLVADDVLYLKADKQSAGLFEDRGLTAFEYVKNGKAMKMSYFMAPEEIFDDPDAARTWAQHAWEAALRAKRPRGKRQRKDGKN